MQGEIPQRTPLGFSACFRQSAYRIVFSAGCISGYIAGHADIRGSGKTCRRQFSACICTVRLPEAAPPSCPLCNAGISVCDRKDTGTVMTSSTLSQI